MKIEEIIKNYPEDHKLKIGSNEGNGYFYCGTVGDWLQNGNTYSEQLKEMIRNKLFKYVSNCEGIILSLCKDVTRDSENGRITASDYSKSLEARIINIARMINCKNNTKKRLDNFINMNEREIVETFEADLAVEYPECLVVIVKGSESGKFWTTDELEENHIGINVAAESALIGMGI